MLFNNPFLHLAFTISFFPFFGLSAAPGDILVGTSPIALKPIDINDFEIATGIRRRAAEDFSHLDPGTQAQLIYGRPGNDGQLLLANMTLFAPDGLQIVMMERFEPLTSAVDCKGDDGEMSLTFKSQEVFDYAINTWGFINEAQEERFLLIANHDGCGPDDERQPYLITDIREDKAKLTTYLTAQPAAWSDVAGTYKLDFGRAAMSQPGSHSGPQRRGLLGDIFNGVKDVVSDAAGDVISGVGDVISDVGDVFRGDIAFKKSANFPVTIGVPGEIHPIINNPPISIACTDCFVTGSIQAIGHLSVEGFRLQEFTLAASPQDFAAKLQLDANITASLGSSDSLQHTIELFKAPVPGAGIVVPKIFSLGAIMSYEVGVSSSFSGSASMSFGITASMPNTAAVTADVLNPGQSSATGFEGGVFDPFFNLNELSASLTMAAFAQPKLSFEVSITRVGKLGIALGVKGPVISASLTAGNNETGFCSQEPGASKTGVQLSSDVALEVNLKLDANLGDDNEDTSSTPAESNPPVDPNTPVDASAPPADADEGSSLFKFSRPLLSKCFPLDLPGFSPVASSNAMITTDATNIAPSTLPIPPFVTATTTAIDMVTGVPEATLITATAAESASVTTNATNIAPSTLAESASATTDVTNIAPSTLPVPPIVNATTAAESASATTNATNNAPSTLPVPPFVNATTAAESANATRNATNIAPSTLPAPPFVNATTAAIKMVTGVPEAKLVTATAADSTITVTAAESTITATVAESTITVTVAESTVIATAAESTITVTAAGNTNATERGATVVGRSGRFVRY